MFSFRCIKNIFSKTGFASAVGLLSLAITHSVMSAPAQTPLFVTMPVKPLMMLNMSNDHQLFFKAYDDYSDLDPEAKNGIETTYKHSYDYYGYFDSKKCYEYESGVFVPKQKSEDKYCTNQWSGNFLNWATMTRMDAVRKILYGGYRSKDSEDETILERVLLPNDAHSFAKFFNGPNINKVTPFNSVPEGLTGTQATGITICNTTKAGNVFSQNATTPPLLRVARGNHSLWASNERWQCRWSGEVSAGNGNDPDVTDFYASSGNPNLGSVGLAANGVTGDFIVRVKVCVPGFLEDNCRIYPDGNHKPAGLLQRYGEPNDISFGLITGSYSKNKSGGVLRKNISGMANEINLHTNGTFKAAPSSGGIINTLNLLRIYGYNFNDGTYGNSSASGDNCDFGLSGFSDGRCTNWGNPQSEIFLESLRYFAGKNASSTFNTNDTGKISGLVTADWSDPLSENNYCAPLSVIQFNASTSSYDDSIGSTGLPGLNVVAETKEVGDLEDLSGMYFVGESGADDNQLCTAKNVTDLSSVRGTCPDAPRLQGSYFIAGLAKYARENDIRTDLEDSQSVQTYGVALSPAVPAITVKVPGGDKEVKILPACQNTQLSTTVDGISVSGSARRREGNCAIVDFKVIDKVESSSENSGKLYVNWEAAEQGGDYDQDMWGIIEYTVTSSVVEVTTKVIQQSTGRPLGFGYIISGTESDGFKVHSGVNDYRNSADGASCSTAASCTCHSGSGTQTCNLSDATTKTYIVGTSSAKMLEPPLYYAAKWGGYSKKFEEDVIELEKDLDEEVKARDPQGDSYFFATDPRKLEASLEAAFKRVAEAVGTASSVATNSTRLIQDSYFYQAKFDTTDWSGTLQSLTRSGNVWDISKTTDELGADREIKTADESGNLVDFKWASLPAEKKLHFPDGAVSGEALVEWIRGDRTHEDTLLRKRKKLLGDIVSSSPVASGNKSPRYNQLPAPAGPAYANFAKAGGVIYVGANDGMLHAFDAESMEEIFAYIPTAVFPKLANLTKANYGSEFNPHQYTVDGSLYVGDAYISGGGVTKSWKTVLFGSLGAGGRSVFALDVTKPDEPKLLFELDETDYPELGYTLGQPAIVPLRNGKWAAVFGNGYESGEGSQLFVIDLDNPKNSAHSRVLDTGGGSGLSTPALLPNALGQIEYAYAGDLLGNIWKFDLTSTDPDEWKVDYSKKPLFKAKDKDGKAQPITGGLTLGVNEVLDSSIMVYFGTGKYFDYSDNLISPELPAPAENSFYAIVDQGPIEYSARDSVLHKKTMSSSGSGRSIQGEKIAVTEGGVASWDNAVDWASSSVNGWYLDFNLDGGERIITKPVLLMDRLIFNTVIPSSKPCEYGGQSWAMELIAIGDKNLAHTVMGDNANTQLGNLVVGESGIMTGIGGTNNDDMGLKVDCNVKGTCEGQDMLFWEGWRGRMNWRQIR